MDDCIFCKIIKGELPSYKVYEDEYTYALLDIFPVNEYHTLVIPKKHYVDMFDIPEDELVSIMKTVKKIADLYKTKLGINNIQIINNSGAEAQQIVFHIHFHIIPRYPGDDQNIILTKNPKLHENANELLQKLND